MRCPYCGNEQPAGKFCKVCGAAMPEAPQQPQQPYGAQQGGYQQPYNNQQPGGYPQQQQQYQGPYNRNAQPMGGGGACSFDGSGGEYFGILIVNSLLLLITCGFAYPWVVCRNLKWRKSHTIINGRRLAFTGQAGDLLGKWVVWWLLSIVTCGIYALWLSVRIKEWEASHTCYADLNPTDGLTFADSYYDGEVGERFGQQLVSNLLMSITCGIYQPWAVVRMTTYDFNHTVINGDRLAFTGTGSGYWGENSVVGLLTGITCGLYSAWGICRINQWTYRNTYVASSGNYHA